MRKQWNLHWLPICCQTKLCLFWYWIHFNPWRFSKLCNRYTIKRTSSHYFSYKVTYLVLDKTICQASLSATGCPPITMKMSTHKREKICRRSKSDAVAHFLLCGWLLAQLGKNIYEITYIVICTDFSWSDEHNILQIIPKYDNRFLVELHVQ